MTQRETAIEYLHDGMTLLKKHGLFGSDENAHTFAIDHTLMNLKKNDGAAEIAAALQALYEAKRLITARASIEGKRIVMGDWFMSLAVSLALPGRNAVLTSFVSRELCRVGEDANHPFFSVSKTTYLKTIDEVCAAINEDSNEAVEILPRRLPLNTIPAINPPAYEKLLSKLELACYKETAATARHALARMEDVFSELFTGDDACERDGFIYDAVMSGGKRLRPLLVRLCAGFGDTNGHEDEIVDIMVIIELMHSASLVHDDIVDRSPMRRSRATINAQKGDGYAAMCGFTMVASSLRLLNEITNNEIPAVIAGIPKRMCEGEFLQFEIENKPNEQSETEYYERIKRKTAALIEGSCLCGAMASGAPKSVLDALSIYGKALGTLFQLRDDLLDCEQQPTDGKPVSQDIERGVYSLPVIYARDISKDDAKLQTILQKHIKSSADISYLLEACRTTGGLAYTQNAIKCEALKAEAALATLPQGAWTEALGLLLTSLAGSVADPQKIVRMIP